MNLLGRLTANFLAALGVVLICVSFVSAQTGDDEDIFQGGGCLKSTINCWQYHCACPTVDESCDTGIGGAACTNPAVGCVVAPAGTPCECRSVGGTNRGCKCCKK
jgi:hypothetical protein